jgi:hypothetical protein
MSNAKACLSEARKGGFWPYCKYQTMDKLQLTGRNLGRVFNFRSVHLHSEDLWCYQSNCQLKNKNSAHTTYRFSPVDIALPDQTILKSIGRVKYYSSYL